MKRRHLVLPIHFDLPYGSRALRRLASLRREAFSLVEMLVVVALIGIVMGFVVPAFQMINRAQALTVAANGVAGMLERGRAYAMANDLYVYVGIAEVNADQPATAVPQQAATTATGGRLAIAAVAAREGTRGYTMLSNLPSPAWTSYNNGAGLTSLGKVEVFENVHLVPALSNPSNGGMARPSAATTYQLGQDTCKSLTPFAWPLGSPLDASQCQYYFTKVIQIDPRGTARIQYATNQDNIAPWMEIALQQTHGSTVPPLPSTATGAVAAVIVDGVTGSVRIYRP